MNGQAMWPSDLVGDGLCSCAPGNSCIYTVLYFLSKSRVWIASNYPRLNLPKVKHDRLKRTPSNGNTVWIKAHYEKQKTTDMIPLTKMMQGMLGMLSAMFLKFPWPLQSGIFKILSLVPLTNQHVLRWLGYHENISKNYPLTKITERLHLY